MINSIQLLRAFAAFGVVFAHYELFGWKTGGFGVDIFFIISGFIIAFVVNTNTKGFFKKRVARVVPLYTFATLLTAILALFRPQWFKNVIVNSEALLKSLLYIPYRIENSGPILSLGWTLNNEMFFYMVMSICILLIKNKKYLAIACGGGIMMFFIVLNIFPADNYISNFYADGLLPEFVMGILLYYLWHWYKDFQNVNINYIIFFLAIIALGYMIYCDLTHELRFGSRNVWRGIPSFIVSFAFLLLERYINPNTKVNRFLIELGDASYVMYLFHPFVMFGLMRVIYPVIFKENYSVIVEILKFVIMLIFLFIACILLYRYLDKPMAKWTKKALKA